MLRFFNAATLGPMHVDGPTFIDGFTAGFLMGFLVSLLMSGLFFGYSLVMRPNSVSHPEVKSRAASASN